ncbi:Fe-S cluster assembly protein SufD [Gryllotalpicola protaetiae]|uniref:Fe-S cluster assembly protein SufD n=1 Tax=Gryllotalpicola protaetiae TaxID=2419771 RepID=A0A387BSB7_9MICO|nr:Fe-S cluster assembly protein SufD [Gryllotalpicola protaetiae]
MGRLSVSTTYTETEVPALPSAPVQTRSERPTSVDVNDFDAVTGREVQWKYTPVGELTELTEGALNGASYDFTVVNTGGIRTSWVGRDHKLVGSAGLPEDRASANAWTHFERALLIELSSETSFEATLTRASLGTAARGAHTIVSVAPNTHATLVLENRGDALLTENVEIVVGDGANLTLVSVQDWSDASKHVAAHFAKVGRDAKLKHVVVSLGGKIVRLNPSARLAGPGADTELLGVYFADAGQHLEHQVYVFHEAANGKSRVTYKGALQGEAAHTVWIGDVLIGPDAVGTDSYEQNRNLVLTEGTRADSVPNLEIETGDIAGAGHASATGRFDDEQLFYLQSRGITEDEARRLVVRGFLVEIIQQIGVASLEERLNAAIEQELAGGAR